MSLNTVDLFFFFVYEQFRLTSWSSLLAVLVATLLSCLAIVLGFFFFGGGGGLCFVSVLLLCR